MLGVSYDACRPFRNVVLFCFGVEVLISESFWFRFGVHSCAKIILMRDFGQVHGPKVSPDWLKENRHQYYCFHVFS